MFPVCGQFHRDARLIRVRSRPLGFEAGYTVGSITIITLYAIAALLRRAA